MKFFSWLLPKKQKIAIRHVPAWSSLSMDQWRLSDARTAYVKRLLQDTMFSMLLGTLQNSMPMPRISSAAFDAGVVQGYMLCLNNLILAGESLEEPPMEVEPTYDRPVEDLIEPVET